MMKADSEGFSTLEVTGTLTMNGCLILDFTDASIDGGSDKCWYQNENQNNKRNFKRSLLCVGAQKAVQNRAKQSTCRVIDDVDISKSSNAVDNLQNFECRAHQKAKQNCFAVNMLFEQKRKKQTKRNENKNVYSSVFEICFCEVGEIHFKSFGKGKHSVVYFGIENSKAHIAFERNDPNKQQHVEYKHDDRKGVNLFCDFHNNLTMVEYLIIAYQDSFVKKKRKRTLG